MLFKLRYFSWANQLAENLFTTLYETAETRSLPSEFGYHITGVWVLAKEIPWNADSANKVLRASFSQQSGGPFFSNVHKSLGMR